MSILILITTQVHHYSVAMEKTLGVEFRNVGNCYFPQSRVDCHYTINSQHTWASNDWIGLFKVRQSNLQDFSALMWLFCLIKVNLFFFLPSGWLVINQGLPYVCVGSSTIQLQRRDFCELLR